MGPGSQATADGGAGPSRSGGKILKRRRNAASRATPYDRPTQTPSPAPESPNWLTGLVFPAKMVAGGATKLLSSLWNPMSWGSSSSSSDIDSDSSEDGIEVDSEDNGNPSNQQKKPSSPGKSEILHLVEQLLMLENYTREECDRLIEIIVSRVVDYPTREGVDAAPSKVLSRTGSETPNIHSQAVIEAKKWIAEKKIGSSSKSGLDHGIYASKSVVTPHVNEGEAGSPVDVAKSYMRSRPPWASPINHNDALTPSPVAADLFKERTPYSSVGGNSFPSAKRDHLSAGSWNIQDEIRRLRSKATEDLLSSCRSTKLASFTLDHDTTERSLANDKAVEVMKLTESVSLEAPKSVDEIASKAAEGGTLGLSDTRTITEGLPMEDPSIPVQEQNQGMDSVEVQGQGAAPDKSQDTLNPDNEQDGRQFNEGNLDEERSNNNDMIVDDNNSVEGNCELMTESTDIPEVNENEAIVNGSQEKTDGPTQKRTVTRSSRYSRGGKGRGKR